MVALEWVISPTIGDAVFLNHLLSIGASIIYKFKKSPSVDDVGQEWTDELSCMNKLTYIWNFYLTVNGISTKGRFSGAKLLPICRVIKHIHCKNFKCYQSIHVFNKEKKVWTWLLLKVFTYLTQKIGKVNIWDITRLNVLVKMLRI